MEPFTVKKTVPGDLPAIVRLFQAAIGHMCDQGIDQWDDEYPGSDLPRQDIADGSQYLCLQNGTLAAAFALDGNGYPEYDTGSWRCDGPYTVLHRLCVNPDLQGQGVGKRTMLEVVRLSREGGAAAIRLDAFSQNPAALRLYEGMGFQRVGEVEFRKGCFYLYEKLLEEGDQRRFGK